MKRTSLGFLFALNAILLGAIYLTAGPVSSAEGQFARNGARYTMISAQSDGAREEATVYVIDLETGSAVPVRFEDGRNRFRVSRGRSLVGDVASLSNDSRNR